MQTSKRQGPAQKPGIAGASDAEDDVLISRIAARDREAFTMLYQRYAPRLASFLHQRLARPDLVDDVLHETLLAVWQGAAHFRGQSQLSTWIFRIAQRQVHQAHLSCQRTSALPVSLAGTAPEDSERLVLHREHLHTLACALAALAPAQRTALDLAYAQGWSIPAIAANLGCSVSTVKTRLHQARRRLAAQLAHDEWAPARAV